VGLPHTHQVQGQPEWVIAQSGYHADYIQWLNPYTNYMGGFRLKVNTWEMLGKRYILQII